MDDAAIRYYRERLADPDYQNRAIGHLSEQMARSRVGMDFKIRPSHRGIGRLNGTEGEEKTMEDEKKVRQKDLAGILGVSEGSLSLIRKKNLIPGDTMELKGRKKAIEYDFESARELILRGWKNDDKRKIYLAKLDKAFGTPHGEPDTEPVIETAIQTVTPNSDNDEQVLMPHKESRSFPRFKNVCNAGSRDFSDPSESDLRVLYAEGTTLVLKLAAFLDRLDGVLNTDISASLNVRQEKPSDSSPSACLTRKREVDSRDSGVLPSPRKFGGQTARAANAPASGPFRKNLLLRKSGKIFSADLVWFKNRADYDGFISDNKEHGIVVEEISSADVRLIRSVVEGSGIVSQIDGDPVLECRTGGESVNTKRDIEPGTVYPTPPGM